MDGPVELPVVLLVGSVVVVGPAELPVTVPSVSSVSAGDVDRHAARVIAAGIVASSRRRYTNSAHDCLYSIASNVNIVNEILDYTLRKHNQFWTTNNAGSSII